MSTSLLQNVLTLTAPVTIIEWAVLIVLAHHADRKTKRCCLTLDTIAHQAHFSPRHIGRATSSLSSKGLINIHRAYCGLPNTYTLTLPNDK